MSETEGTTPAPKSATPNVVDDGDAIRVTRPVWMPVETWIEVRARIKAKLDEVVELVAGQVVDR